MLRLWGIQDSLLQQYRSMFLSSQSILFSFGTSLALISSKHPLAIIGVIVLFALSAHLLKIWLTVTTERAEGVNFCQNEIINMEKDDSHTELPLHKLNEYLEKNKPEIKWCHLTCSPRELFGHQQKTRLTMQLLPTLFFWLWVLLLAISVISAISS